MFSYTGNLVLPSGYIHEVLWVDLDTLFRAAGLAFGGDADELKVRAAFRWEAVRQRVVLAYDYFELVLALGPWALRCALARSEALASGALRLILYRFPAALLSRAEAISRPVHVSHHAHGILAVAPGLFRTGSSSQRF